ncbi:MAG: hypothetical protein Q7S99_00580 [Parvibaculum sp.]|nr:hypothetical protein [Parvibaculum sp.]
MSGVDNTGGVGPDKAGPLAMSEFAVEHLVAPPAATGNRRLARSVELCLALALNILLFAALFYRPAYTLPPLSQEPEAIAVDLVPPPQPAPPPAPPPAPEPQVQQPEKPKPYEFKGSGDEKLKEAGSKPDVKAEKKAPTPEKAAEKPETDAPEKPATDLPDWMKSVEQGYDIPAPRKSSSRNDTAYDSDDTQDQMGDGAGDAYSNAMKDYIVRHLQASSDDYNRIRSPIIIAIKVDRAGNLLGLVPLALTGIRSFDEAIIKSLYDARPYAPLPPGSPETYTFRFTLRPPKQ